MITFPGSLLKNPHFFLHKIDPVTETVSFIKTTRDILSSSAFIDGRTDLRSEDDVINISLQDAFQWHRENPPIKTDKRFIFHISFCGSTLLARACDSAGRVFSYKEPQVFVDLATLKAEKHAYFTDPDIWHNLIDIILRQFSTGFAPGEITLIKPSNWVNSIIPDLMSRRGRAIFMTTDPQDFLVAVFRGGQERITYCCNFLMHIQTALPELSHLIAQAAPLNTDPLLGAARLILTAYHMQKVAFEQIMSRLQPDQFGQLAFKDLLAQPKERLAYVSETLGLKLTAEEIAQNIPMAFKKYSKASEEDYQKDQAKQQDQKIIRDFSHVFGPALTWYYETLVAK